MSALQARFEAKVDRRGPGECWPWRACTDVCGYGRIKVDGESAYAHRVAYELYIGPIPAGCDVDHVSERGCHGGGCTNPAHLEAVTRSVNVIRQAQAGRMNHAPGLAAMQRKRAA